MKLYRKRVTLLSWIVLGLVVIGSAALYARQFHELTRIRNRASGVEATLFRMRSVLNRLGGPLDGRSLVTEEMISEKLGALTAAGKLDGVTFLSITPGAPDASGNAYRKLPVVFETESSFQSLGDFLGTLDELEKAFVTLSELTMKPDEKNRELIRAKFTVTLYLEPAHGG